LKTYLDRAQLQLYRLIWQRFLASQMTAAVYDTLRVDIEGRSPQHTYLLRANGSTLRFPGFLIVYQEAAEEDNGSKKEENAQIPADIAKGQRQILKEVLPEQHFTQPPPRYSEATLVRTLEENGIGRPSTYAPILSTLQQRGYVRRENKRLVPTETGVLVNDLLVAYFPDIVDTGFTAQMEARLDEIARGKVRWVDVSRDFYPSFAQEVERARSEMPEKKQGPEPVGRDCPECGRPLVFRYGRYGKFISCSGFPECRYTEPYLEKIGVQCPKDGGDIVLRRSRKGRIFYGCANYPACDFTSWTRPIPQPCPACGGLLTIINKKNVRCMVCGETFPQAEILKDVDKG
jgi:DNA topoisomerase-1